jgi:hypothetical protein
MVDFRKFVYSIIQTEEDLDLLLKQSPEQVRFLVNFLQQVSVSCPQTNDEISRVAAETG